MPIVPSNPGDQLVQQVPLHDRLARRVGRRAAQNPTRHDRAATGEVLFIFIFVRAIRLMTPCFVLPTEPVHQRAASVSDRRRRRFRSRVRSHVPRARRDVPS